MSESITVREKILIAAVFCEQLCQRRTVRLEDLIVACWRLFPSSFSLSGFDLPHSNRVIAKLSGGEGLVATGELERVEGGLSATVEGRSWVARRTGLALDAPDDSWRAEPYLPVLRPRADAQVVRLRRDRDRDRPRTPRHPKAPTHSTGTGWWSPPLPQRFVGSPRIRATADPRVP